MAVVTLRPSGDGTTTGWGVTGGAGSHASAIVDDPDTNDADTSYVLSPNVASGTMFVGLDDVPGDFDPAAINSITIKVAHRRLNTPVMAVDDGTVNAFLTRADEATAISTTPTAVASPIQGGYALTSFTPSPTGTHTVSDWNGARLALAFVHANNQTVDTDNQIRITAAEVTIDYDPAAAGANLVEVADEALGLLEAGGSVGGAIVAEVPMAIALAEAISQVMGRIQAISEAVGITETIVTTRALARIVGEAIGISEAVASARTLARSIAETLGITETIARSRTLVRIRAEAMAITEIVTDVLESTFGAIVRVIDEVVQLGESVTRSRTLVRLRAETLDVVEAVIRSRTMARVRAEAVHILEAGGSVESRITAVVDEAVHIAETIVDVLTATGGAALTRVIDELVWIVEEGGVDTAIAYVRRVAEAVWLVETAISTIVGNLLVRVIDEVIQMSETIVRARTMARSITETIALSEVVVRARSLARQVAETVDVVEAVARARTLARSVVEVVHVIETRLGKLPGAIIRVITETLGVVEAVATARIMARSIAETVRITEAVVDVLESTIQDLVRIVVEAVQVAETVTRSRTMVRMIAETVRIVEMISTPAIVAVAVFQSVRVTARNWYVRLSSRNWYSRTKPK
jgi:hypothetical protein